MKKTCYIMLTALMCLLALNASAFTLFVNIDNPANLSAVETYCNGTKTPLNLSAEMPLEASFPDDGMRYLYITPNPGCYITRLMVMDEDGNVLSDKSGAWKSLQLFTVRPEYDYGTLYIETSATQPMDGKLTVNLNGNPNNVNMHLGGSREIELKRGTQTISFTTSTESTVYLLPVGVTKFYQVFLDGVEKTATGVSDESGKITYQYTLYVKNNSVIDINVDYPEVYRDCSIKVSEGLEGFIQSVKLDSTIVENWTAFQAKMGQKLIIVANTNDYNIDSFTCNGRNSSFTLNNWDTMVENDDIDIQMTGSIIERPYTARVVTYNWNYIGQQNKEFYRYDFRRSDNKAIKLVNGENSFTFNDDENPFTLEIASDDVNKVQLAINGEIQLPEPGPATYGFASYVMTLKDGDLVQVALDTNVPSAIENVQNAESGKQNAIYNLNGQRVNSNPGKGLYIKNGKKIIY